MIERVRGARRALVAPAGSRRARARAAGPADRGARPSRQVPAVAALRRGLPGPAPEDDRRRAGAPDPEPLHTRVRIGLGRARLGFARAAAACDQRPQALRHRRAAARGARARGATSRPPRAGALRRATSPPSTCASSPRHAQRPIKALLLDQRRVAGSETSTPTRRCSRAVSTLCARPASSTRQQIEQLREGIVGGTARGHRRRGREHRRLPPRRRLRGSFQDEFLVHLRAGAPACGAAPRSSRSSPPAGAPTCARPASPAAGRGARRAARLAPGAAQ